MKNTKVTVCPRVGFAALFALLLLSTALAGPALAAKGGNGGGGNGGGGGGGGGGKPPKSYTIGGVASGISGDVVLQNNGGDDLAITSDGSFTFPTKLPDGSDYAVTVASAPESLICEVANGSGKIAGSNVTGVEVTCTSQPGLSYSVGGSVAGLDGSLTLQNNDSDDLVLSTNGTFTFDGRLADQTSYAVTVASQPAGQRCTVVNGSGVIAAGDVTDVSVLCEAVLAAAVRVEGAGDSIMRGYNASCTGNTGFFDLFCYGAGDQNNNSFLDGSSSSVVSLVDRYIELDADASGGKNASASGSEMTDPAKNNFATQAAAIVASATQPLTVLVELGGNDLCNRTSGADMYTDQEWQAAVDAGLETLVAGLPDGSTVFLSSVPRVQDLRSAGLLKQSGDSGVDCESFWATYDVCRVATASDTYFGVLEERQRRYNEILAARAIDFNSRAAETGVEVVAEYRGEGALSVGTYGFAPHEINGGDCFHPSISGQNKLSEVLWGNNPFK
jgi:hypothetical protein